MSKNSAVICTLESKWWYLALHDKVTVKMFQLVSLSGGRWWKLEFIPGWTMLVASGRGVQGVCFAMKKKKKRNPHNSIAPAARWKGSLQVSGRLRSN